jgi:hypothetical protein
VKAADRGSPGRRARRAAGALIEARRGRAAALSPAQVKHAFRVARARSGHASRAEAVLAISLGLGLRAKELASLKWSGVRRGRGLNGAVIEGDLRGGRARRRVLAQRAPGLDHFGEPFVSQRHEIGKALAAYPRLAPSEIRRVAGPFGCLQWVVLAMLGDAP